MQTAFCVGNILLLLMAGAGHGAALTAAAITDDGLALPFLSDHADDNRRDDRDQHRADDDRPDIGG
jgi:hypothetical protein